MTDSAKSSDRSRKATARSAQARPADGKPGRNGASPRLLVHGFYGAGNLGDEAILAGIISQFHRRLKDVELMVVSQDPQDTERRHPVRAIDHHDLHGQSEALSQASLLIFGGGGLCNDYWLTRPADVFDDAWGGLAYYLRLPLLALLRDVPVAVYAQGVGPLVSPEARRMVRYVFDQAADITVRDSDSADLLREIGVALPVEVGADAAFSLAPDEDEACSVLASCNIRVGERPVIGVSVRPFASITPSRLSLLARVAGRFAESVNAHLLILPFCTRGPNADLASCQAFADALPPKVESTVVQADLSPQGMLGLIGQTDLVLATRYHASVFAIHRHVPVIPVAYDPKVGALFAEAGLEALTVLNPNALEPERVKAALGRAWEAREKLRGDLARAADRLCARASKAADRVCELAERSCQRQASIPGRQIKPIWIRQTDAKSVRTRLTETQERLDETREQAEQIREAEAQATKRSKDLESQLRQSRSELAASAKRVKEADARAVAARRLAEDHASRAEAAQQAIKRADETLGRLRTENDELKKDLRFANERVRDIAEQLQQIWDSPTWQLLNRLHNSRVVGGSWRLVKRVVPVRCKEFLKHRLHRSSGSTPAAAQTTSGVVEDLRDFLDRVDKSDRPDLAVFVAGVKYVQSEGQRVTQIVREFIRNDVPVLLLYFRWQSEYHQPVPRSEDPLFFQLPLDLFEPQRRMVIEYPFRSSLRRTCIFEFPHPSTFQWVNEFNLSGWCTLYDIIDDWEEFHEAGKAVWYEPAVEQYLCANAGAVTAIVPLLAEKARQWIPDLEVGIVPNGVSPDSFVMTLPKVPLTRGKATVGYFGYLAQAWFDWEMVAKIAAGRGDWQFHIIGYGEPVPVKLTDNVQLLGKVAHHMLYGYTQNWDVAIVPFKPTTLSKGADPIKVYEYLTLGLPVVTTDIPHLRTYPGVYVAESTEEFDRLLEVAAKNGAPRDRVRPFLEKCTWYRRGLALIEAAQAGRRETILATAASGGGAT